MVDNDDPADNIIAIAEPAWTPEEQQIFAKVDAVVSKLPPFPVASEQATFEQLCVVLREEANYILELLTTIRLYILWEPRPHTQVDKARYATFVAQSSDLSMSSTQIAKTLNLIRAISVRQGRLERIRRVRQAEAIMYEIFQHFEKVAKMAETGVVGDRKVEDMIEQTRLFFNYLQVVLNKLITEMPQRHIFAIASLNNRWRSALQLPDGRNKLEALIQNLVETIEMIMTETDRRGVPNAQQCFETYVAFAISDNMDINLMEIGELIQSFEQRYQEYHDEQKQGIPEHLWFDMDSFKLISSAHGLSMYFEQINVAFTELTALDTNEVPEEDDGREARRIINDMWTYVNSLALTLRSLPNIHFN